jgi:molybdate transport system ATP-binding protein
MSLAVDVMHRFGSFLLEARFVSDGRLTAFFGRSGSGKTSLINIIAGVVRPDRGRVVLDGTTLVDTDRGIFVPKSRRRVGYVFQEGRLFPHLTVRQNLLFGRWFTPPRERHVSLDQVLDLLDIGQLLDRRPGGLSGGEKQRVAIGRALLTSPRLLLMDEPLASLDDSRKDEILPFIERLRDEARVPIVYVSHSLAEVARLATTVVVFQDGRIIATGPPTDVLGRADVLAPYVAAEGGVLIEATVCGHDRAFGLTALQSRAGLFQAPHLDLPVGTPVRMRIRARDVMIATARPDGLSALNVLSGVVRALDFTAGGLVEVGLDCGGVRLAARLTRKSIATLQLEPGHEVYAVIKSVALDRDTLGRAPTPIELTSADASTTQS